MWQNYYENFVGIWCEFNITVLLLYMNKLKQAWQLKSFLYMLVVEDYQNQFEKIYIANSLGLPQTHVITLCKSQNNWHSFNIFYKIFNIF